jgi:hypothetical protein
MGMIGKGVVAVMVAAGAFGFMMGLQKAGRRSGPAGAESAEDRCADRIGSRLPSGAFVVMHTPPDSNGRTEWLIDHGGVREPLACLISPGGEVVLTALHLN